MSIFLIKIIACITMVIDHIKYAIPITNGFITQYFGRISFPLFAFLIGEGYRHTSNLKKYYKRLIMFALISQIPFMLFRTLVGEWRMLNILFTLLLGLIAITIFDKMEKKYYYSLPIVVAIVFLGWAIRVDYGWFGVVTVFVLYLFGERKFLRILGFLVVSLIYYYPRLFIGFSKESLLSFIFTILSVMLLVFYNGKLGRKTKYGYYIFYPLHMFVLWGLSMLFA